MAIERNKRVLVVDDDEHIRRYLRDLLTVNGCQIEEASDGEKAVEMLGQREYDVVLTDLMLPGTDGLEVLRKARGRPDPPEVLVITAYGTIDSAIEAVRAGAFDYLTKPLTSQKLLITIERAAERGSLRREVNNLRKEVQGHYAQDLIVASSPAMRRVFELVDIVCATDSSVVIEGESGTGKELVARAIHFRGPRGTRPFIALNCAALPGELLESELFGHAKGAFTGAVTDKKGLFEAADQGTLLLDEIGDMPSALQAKLLRVLQDGELRRVGSTATLTVDVRIIAATNRDILELIRQGKFREDLYYRLNVIPIRIPPLRERREDIIPLAHHFVAMHGPRLGKEIHGIAPGALERMMSYSWPGNIRELENVIERAITLCSGSVISATEFDFTLSLGARRAGNGAAEQPAAAEENAADRQRILSILAENDWNQTRAAQALGIGRNTLWRKIRKYGLEKRH